MNKDVLLPPGFEPTAFGIGATRATSTPEPPRSARPGPLTRSAILKNFRWTVEQFDTAMTFNFPRCLMVSALRSDTQPRLVDGAIFVGAAREPQWDPEDVAQWAARVRSLGLSL